MEVFTFATTRLLLVITTALGLGVGIFLFLNERVTLGTVYLIVYYIGLLENPLSEFRRLMTELQAAAASAGRVRDLFALQPIIAATAAAPVSGRLAQGSLTVEFEHVSFHYAATNGGEMARLSVLDDVSFCLPAGRVLGLLGRTGSGKTTLRRLLFRLYDVVDGGVRLGGENVCTLSTADLRRRVGMVTQEVQLFGGTLRDNITLFDPAVDDEAILAACVNLGCGRGTSPGPMAWIPCSNQAVAVFRRAKRSCLPSCASSSGPWSRSSSTKRRRDSIRDRTIAGTGIDRLLWGRTAIIIAHRLKTVHAPTTF